MPLSRLLSVLFTDAATDPDSPSGPDSAPGTRDGSKTDSQSSTVLYECRNCGTNVDADATACPACGSDDIVTYTID